MDEYSQLLPQPNKSQQPRRRRSPKWLFFILLGLLAALTLVLVHKQSAEQRIQQPLNVPDKVPVEFFVMSRCPDAALMEQVFAEVVPQVHTIMDVKLNYFAKLDSNSTLGAKCAHGEAECHGNIHELCALKHTKELPLFWRFLVCLNKKLDMVGDMDFTLECASAAGLDTAALLQCVGGQEGKELFRQSVENTVYSGVKRSATVFVAGQKRCVEDSGWRECPGGHRPEDFVRDICKAQKGAKPSICSQYPGYY